MKKLLILFCLIFLPLATADIGFNEQDYGVHFDSSTTTTGNITNNYYSTNISGNLTNISQMQDVDVSGVSDNDVLKWDDALMKWIDSSLNSILSFGDNWFSFTDTNEISFNEVKLNATIDMRASGLGDNSSWNQTFADTLYSPIGSVGNSSFNQTLTDSLYSPIGTGGNSSFNQTLTNDLYIPVNSNLTQESENSFSNWINGTFVIVGRT